MKAAAAYDDLGSPVGSNLGTLIGHQSDRDLLLLLISHDRPLIKAGRDGCCSGLLGRSLHLAGENGGRWHLSEEDGVPLYGTPAGYGNLVHTQ
ncbi:hypothetical protein ACLOJK_027242 [Asimina triloba]